MKLDKAHAASSHRTRSVEAQTRKGSQLFICNKINKFNLRSIIHSIHVFMHPIII